MRAITTAQATDLAALERYENVRVYVANSSATLVDLSTYFQEATISASVDRMATVASVVMQREVVGTSLAPLMASPAVIDVGRRIKIDVSVVETGDSEDWQTIFDGYVDEPSWGSSQSVVTLTCRDKAKTLLDTWIETEALYGNDDLSENIDVVMQEIIDDLSVAVTVTVVGSPSFAVVEYTQQRQSLADALQALNDLIGWDLRYKWNTGSSDFELTFEEPPRAKTTLDHTFTTADYFDVADIRKTNADIRNAVEVQYNETNSVVATDATSIAEYERRYMYIDAITDPQIASSTIATTLATTILGDTAQPLATQSIECRFFWPVELGDLYRWPANEVHYSSAQDMAVVAYTHQLSAGGNTTTMQVRGQPSGGTYRWTRKSYVASSRQTIQSGVPAVTVTVAPSGVISASFNASGGLSAVVKGGSTVGSWRVTGAIGSVPTSASVAAVTAVAGTSLVEADFGVFATATAGEIGYVAGIGYTGNDGTGDETILLVDVERFGTTEDGIPDGSVGTTKLADGAVAAGKMTSQAQAWMSTVQFQPSDYQVVAWTTGTIALADGTSDTITNGQVTCSALGTPYYVYYSGTSTLSTTTTLTSVLADEDYILMCVCKQAPDSSQTAFYVPAVGAMGLSEINVNSGNISAAAITAAHIVAGTITANELAANSVTAAKINVASLSAIAADLGTVTAGTLAANVIVASDSFTATFAEFSGTVNVYSGGTVACDRIYQTGGAGQSSLIGGQIHFGSTFSLYEPGVSATAAINITNGPIVDILGTMKLNSATVSLGASDSGGTGYKLLRVPN